MIPDHLLSSATSIFPVNWCISFLGFIDICILKSKIGLSWNNNNTLNQLVNIVFLPTYIPTYLLACLLGIIETKCSYEAFCIKDL